MSENLERIFKVHPAFDKRDPDPEKNYGIHGAEMLFVVKGQEGAVQFVLYTNWMLPHVRKEQDEKILKKALRNGAIPHGIPQIADLPISLGGIPGVLDQIDLNVTYHPMPADLGFHSRKPMYEGHAAIGSQRIKKDAMKRNTDRLIKREGIDELEPFFEETGTFDPCEWLDGAPCYYDGSGLNARPVFELLIEKGSDAVWEYLENYYKDTFHGRTEDTADNIPSTEKHDAQDN